MTDAMDLFGLSLELEAPPPGSTPMLRAVLHGLRGDWDAAHQLAQAQDDSEGAWVHAWLHRIEGDLSNADHWYGRASRPACRDKPRDEWLEIARTLNRLHDLRTQLTMCQCSGHSPPALIVVWSTRVCLDTSTPSDTYGRVDFRRSFLALHRITSECSPERVGVLASPTNVVGWGRRMPGQDPCRHPSRCHWAGC